MADTVTAWKQPQLERRRLSTRGRRRLMRAFALFVMLLYTVLTLFPFTLFIRSFVSTRDRRNSISDSEAAEVNMNAQVTSKRIL